MKILAIETSCDETAVSLLLCKGDEHGAEFKVLGNALLSQIDIHKEYGGVYPMLAKREHAKNLVPVLAATLEEAGMLRENTRAIDGAMRSELSEVLSREPGLAEAFFAFIETTEPPKIDAIAVTQGPGLTPALWVGINFAKALSLSWGIPLVPVNHMEGHLLSALAKKEGGLIKLHNIKLPILALLISGGHTELVLMRSWLSYELLGQTRDDAVGEAYDKVARMMGLPYPGGPEISKLAERARGESFLNPFLLPRPMIDSDNLDFSFSGLKTAVLYIMKQKTEWSETEKGQLAHAFEDAVGEVLWQKTRRALQQTGAKTLTMGGGVSANVHLQRYFEEKMKDYKEVELRIPEREFTTDNAIMIGIAGFFRAKTSAYASPEALAASGTLRLT